MPSCVPPAGSFVPLTAIRLSALCNLRVASTLSLGGRVASEVPRSKLLLSEQTVFRDGREKELYHVLKNPWWNLKIWIDLLLFHTSGAVSYTHLTLPTICSV